MCQHHRPVLPGVVTRELCPLNPVQVGEVGAPDVRRVAAALDVDQENRFIHQGDGLSWDGLVLSQIVRIGRVVSHVDVGTVVHIAGASFPTRTPRAVEETGQFLFAGGYTCYGLWDEVGHQGGYRWVNVEWD